MSSIHTLHAAARSGRSPVSAYAGRQSTHRRISLSLSRETIAAAIIYAAVLFNFGLSFVNANGMQIGRTHVILVELFLVSVTFAFCIRYWSPLMVPWMWVIWLLGTLFIALSLARQTIDPKYVRDVLLIPIFIMLGIAS